MKWRCVDASGNYVTGLDTIHSLGSIQVACNSFVVTDTDALVESTSGQSVLRVADGMFIYNWQTPKSNTPKCYVFAVRFDWDNNGTVDATIVADFKLTP